MDDVLFFVVTELLVVTEVWVCNKLKYWDSLSFVLLPL